MAEGGEAGDEGVEKEAVHAGRDGGNTLWSQGSLRRPRRLPEARLHGRGQIEATGADWTALLFIRAFPEDAKKMQLFQSAYESALVAKLST
jgi:hypothetical protein